MSVVRLESDGGGLEGHIKTADGAATRVPVENGDQQGTTGEGGGTGGGSVQPLLSR